MDPLASGRGTHYGQANGTGSNSSGNAGHQSLTILKNTLITTQEQEHYIAIFLICRIFFANNCKNIF